MQSEPTPTDLMNAIIDLSNATSHEFSTLRSDLRRDLESVEGRLTTRLTSIEGELGGIRYWMSRSDSRFDALEQRKKLQ
jgi:hypothetical protein